jgi:hypothetical protein
LSGEFVEEVGGPGEVEEAGLMCSEVGEEVNDASAGWGWNREARLPAMEDGGGEDLEVVAVGDVEEETGGNLTSSKYMVILHTMCNLPNTSIPTQAISIHSTKHEWFALY